MYDNFQRLCAYYGFINTPITRDEYAVVINSGLSTDDAYNIACDVAAGYRFIDCLRDEVAIQTRL